MSTSDSSMKAFVAEASASCIVVVILDDTISEKLASFGFTPNEEAGLNSVSVNISSVNEKAMVFARLRDCGVCFAAGPDWSPSEVFEFLRSEGLLIGKYRRVAWSGPGRFMITESC